jgi:hypothetical protein
MKNQFHQSGTQIARLKRDPWAGSWQEGVRDMSKQQTQSQGTHRESPENNQNAKQSHDRQDRAKNPADREHDESTKEGGGEESKQGRKQKGSGDPA